MKSIYFDKPPASNWFVSWHQDLTISVDTKADIDGFTHWTVKQGGAIEQEVSCPVLKGGVMIMRPLLLHASHRSTNDRPRRGIHIEFSNLPLPGPITWAEEIAHLTQQ